MATAHLKRTLGISAALAVLTTALTGQGAAAACSWPSVVNGHAPSLHPEGTDYDPTRKAYLVGSLRHGTVSVVHRDGSVRTLVSDPTLISVSGIRVSGGRVYVMNTDPGVSERTSPATQKHVAGLGVYDLRTGHRLRYVDLAAVDRVSEEHFGNDVTVAPDGTAYVTDSFAPIVYRVPAHGRPSVFVRDARLTPRPGDFGLNGIVWQRGRLIVGKYDDGTLWRVSTRHPGSLRRVRIDRTLVGADGFRLRHDGSLITVTNSLAAPYAGKIVVLRPGKGWSTARVVSTTAWPDAVPTAFALGPRGVTYVLSGRLDLLFSGKTADTFTLRRF